MYSFLLELNCGQYYVYLVEHGPCVCFQFLIIFLTTVGYYHQYDTMVYPEFRTSYFEKLTNFFSSNNSNIPDNESMRKKCLVTYLDVFRCDLVHFAAKSSVDEVVNNAIQVVTCLTNQRIAHSDKADVWRDGKLLSLVSIFTCMHVYMQGYLHLG